MDRVKVNSKDYSDKNAILSNSIAYGDGIIIHRFRKEKYELVKDELYLNCDNGNID